MIYPENFEVKIGFDQVRDHLREYCLSPMGEDNLEKISFSIDFDDVSEKLEYTRQFKDVLEFEDTFPAQDYLDMRDILKYLTAKGTIIEREHLHNLNTSLKAMEEVRLYLLNLDEERYDRLYSLAGDRESWQHFIREIDKILDEKGEIRPDASSLLLEIDGKIRAQEKKLYQKIQDILIKARESGWIAGDREVTVRNGRLVLPVLASQKRKVKGFIHDESSSGQTVYIEPEAAFEANNEIRKLKNEYRQEIKRILAEFTDFFRPYISDLIRDYNWLGKIDFIRAKAKFAIQIRAEKPRLVNDQRLDWKKAIHPLLYLLYRKQGKDVVPLDIRLEKHQRILIISGPNAGGKSVCLKTTGLLQYMLQCGLLLPMRADSECGIFSHLFIDIGDEQSLENDLSTYSSHLRNISVFTDNADAKSLVMIDEMGTGTEPQMGGAIAEASIEVLYKKQAFAVITTHYANLKLLADNYPEIVNAAMLFDTDKLKPRFQLKIGNPGNSFAFEIAQNTGLSESLLKRAREKTGKTHLDFEEQLQSLEKDKSDIHEKEHELKVADDLLNETIEKYQRLSKELEENKKQILQQAREEAQRILDNSNRIIENTVREIKENQAEKEKTQQARKKLEQEKQRILHKNKSRPKPQSGAEKKTPSSKFKHSNERKQEQTEALKTGDKVKVKGQKEGGEILDITNKHATVSFGSIKMQIPLKKLERISGGEIKKAKKKSGYDHIIRDMQQKTENFSSSLDLRGKRADEAMNELMHFVDEAILLGIYDLRILHGKGNGVLRNVVREYLSSVSEVKTFHDEHVERGGQGVTIVKLK